MKIQSKLPTSFQTIQETPSLNRNAHSPSYKSTLVGDNQSFIQKAKNYFWQGVDYAKKAWEWIIWALYCFPHEESHFESIESFIEKPTENAKTAAKEPVKTVSKFIMAVLENPAKIEDLKKTKSEAFVQFIKTFKGSQKDAKLFADPKGLLTAAYDFFTFSFTNKTDTHDIFFDFLSENLSLVSSALKQTCEDGLALLGSEEVENSKLKALRHVFQFTLPLIIGEEEKHLKHLFTEMKKRNPLDSAALMELLGALPTFQGENSAALQASFRADALLFRYLLNPGKFFTSELGISGDGKEPFDFRTAFFNNVAAHMTIEHLEKLAALFEKERGSPLVIAVLKDLKEFAKTKNGMKSISANLADAIDLLKSTYDDYKGISTKK